MYRVLITDNLSPAGLKILEDNPEIEVDVRSGLSPEEVREALKSADGIIIRSATKLTEEILQGQPRLKAIVRAGVDDRETVVGIVSAFDVVEAVAKM